MAASVGQIPPRSEKYLFSDTAYTWDSEAIIYAKGRTDIHSTEDLDGKTVDAAQVQTAYMAALGQVFAKVMNTQEMCASLA